MSAKDQFIRDLLSREYGPLSATQRLQREVMDRYSSKSAVEAIGAAMAGFQHNWVKDIGALTAATQLRFVHDFKASSAMEEAIKSLHRQVMSPIDYIKAGPAPTEIAAGMTKLASSPSLRDMAAGAALSLARSMDLGRIAGNSVSTVFATLQADRLKEVAALRESFAGIAAGMLREAFTQFDERLDERDEKAIARFEQLIDEKIASLPANQVTAESLWKFLLTLIIGLASLGGNLYSINDAKQSSKTQAEFNTQMMSVLLRIAGNTERLVPEQDQNTYYVVERQVDLKLKPNNRSAIVTTLFPNQKTRLVQMSHKWIYIEYFDYIEGVPKYGWANKKYLKKLDK